MRIWCRVLGHSWVKTFHDLVSTADTVVQINVNLCTRCHVEMETRVTYG